jgi:hypothetical protein
VKLRAPNPRRALTAIGVVVAVAAAAVVWQHLPTPTDVLGPFDVHGNAGTTVTGRAVAGTVTGVRVTQEVDGVKPAGTWVVVDAELQGVHSTELPHSTLVAGANTYDPSDLFLLKTLADQISPGFTWRGSWAFDVASGLVAAGSSAPLTLRVWVGDGRMDSRLVIRIPTDGSLFSRVDSVTLDKPEQSAS